MEDPMGLPPRLRGILACAPLVLCTATPASAQLEDQLSAYTGVNATGYMKPLVDAFGADLNDGLFHSAHIPAVGLHVSVEMRLMSVHFADEDRTFQGTTEGGFTPQQTVTAPTVIGSGDAVTVSGTSGTSFSFPGGFDLSSFAFAAPQVRVGSVMGTEAIVRYFAIDTGDSELGDLSLFGFGARHSVSQYLGPVFPVDLAVGFFYQSFKLGENDRGGDLVSSDALSFGVQGSKSFGVLEPYGGISYDSHKMKVEYDSDASGTPESIDLEFETDRTLHLTVGLAANFSFVSAHGDFNIADKSSYSVGLAFGF
jgi:hypothetical protein